MLLLPREVANMLEDARVRLGYRTLSDTIREALLDLAVADTDLHLVETRAAALGLPIDREDQNASLARMFDFVAELLAAAREVGEVFPLIASSTPRCHLAVQRVRALLRRLPMEATL
jgi:hypothetical protein